MAGPTGTNGSVEVVNTPEGVRIRRTDGQLSMDYEAGPNGSRASTAQRTTDIANRTRAQVNAKDAVATTAGNDSNVVGGLREASSAQSNEVVGTVDLANSGATRLANDMNAARVALQSQRANVVDPDSSFAGRIRSSLSAVTSSIKVSTESIDATKVEPFKPTGNILEDAAGCAAWYTNLLKTYVTQNLVKRALQTIRSEVEKVEAQFKELQKIADEAAREKKLDEAAKKTAKALLESPSDQHKPKKDNITRGAAIDSMGTDEERRTLTEAERKS